MEPSSLWKRPLSLAALPLEPSTPLSGAGTSDPEPPLPQRDIEDWEAAGVPLPRLSNARPRLSPLGESRDSLQNCLSSVECQNFRAHSLTLVYS